MISFRYLTALRKNCDEKYRLERCAFHRIEHFCISLCIDSNADKHLAGLADFERDNVCVCVGRGVLFVTCAKK